MTPSRIRSARLVLDPLKLDDAGEMVRVLADESLYHYTGGEPPSLDVLAVRFERQVAGSDNPAEHWCNWIIRSVEQFRALGLIQATVTEGQADIAWVIGVPHQGQGFATEAATAVNAWLRDGGIRRIEAHIHPSHVASQAIARKIGLSLSGTIDDDGEEIWASQSPEP